MNEYEVMCDYCDGAGCLENEGGADCPYCGGNGFVSEFEDDDETEDSINE